MATAFRKNEKIFMMGLLARTYIRVCDLIDLESSLDIIWSDFPWRLNHVYPQTDVALCVLLVSGRIAAARIIFRTRTINYTHTHTIYYARRQSRKGKLKLIY